MGVRVLLCAIGNDALHLKLEAGLPARGYCVTRAPAGVLARIDEHLAAADLAIVSAVSSSAPHETLTLLERIRASHRSIPVIVMTRRSSESEALAVRRAGASDYLEESVSLGHLDVAMRLCLRRVPRPLRVDTAPAAAGPQRILGDSVLIQDIRAAVASTAAVDSNVLITGETGTGKDLVAESIHEQSARQRHAFVRVNCAAIPDTLIESELFGHERGAFTGADSGRDGLLTLAHQGTIFFDEIGDMSPAAQAKILRAIESKEIHRLGGKGSVPVNIRVVAATNRDIERIMADGQFRQDLYFRLNVARIHLPPLRERQEDVPVLTQHYIDEFNRRLGSTVEGMSQDVIERLVRYEWPGNVRELRNVVEGTFMKARGGCIALSDLPDQFLRKLEGGRLSPTEREHLLEALLSTNWNKSRAAAQLRWSRMTLYRRMAKYKIEPRFAGPLRRQAH